MSRSPLTGVWVAAVDETDCRSNQRENFSADVRAVSRYTAFQERIQREPCPSLRSNVPFESCTDIVTRCVSSCSSWLRSRADRAPSIRHVEPIHPPPTQYLYKISLCCTAADPAALAHSRQVTHGMKDPSFLFLALCTALFIFLLSVCVRPIAYILYKSIQRVNSRGGESVYEHTGEERDWNISVSDGDSSAAYFHRRRQHAARFPMSFASCEAKSFKFQQWIPRLRVNAPDERQLVGCNNWFRNYGDSRKAEKGGAVVIGRRCLPQRRHGLLQSRDLKYFSLWHFYTCSAHRSYFVHWIS